MVTAPGGVNKPGETIGVGFGDAQFESPARPRLHPIERLVGGQQHGTVADLGGGLAQAHAEAGIHIDGGGVGARRLVVGKRQVGAFDLEFAE